MSTSELAGVEGVEDSPSGRDCKSADVLNSALQEVGVRTLPPSCPEIDCLQGCQTKPDFASHFPPICVIPLASSYQFCRYSNLCFTADSIE